MTAAQNIRESMVRSVFRQVARRPMCAICLCGLFALFASWLMARQRPPLPSWHDEFGYLLSADTLVQGRLTNPTHPMWKHFETFHVIQQPTYASKYPLGQGAALAIGTLLSGEPIVGVWLSLALACAATCWMLQGALPPRWALLGGLLATLRFVFGLSYFGRPYWSQSYFGGAVAALGGALLLGAAVRMTKRPAFSMGIVFGTGLAVLANSRPYEGVLLSSLIGCCLFVRWWNRRELRIGEFIRAFALPVAIVMLPTFVFMGYYNWRVTGSPGRFPYLVHEETYGMTPLFLWQPPRPETEYHHEVMRRFHREMPKQGNADAPSDEGPSATNGRRDSVWSLTWRRASLLADFYLGMLPALCVLPVLPMLRRKDERAVLVLLALFLLGMFQVSWFFPQYAAPAAGLMVFIAVSALRRVRTLKWGDWRIGRVAAAGLIGVVLLTTVLPTAIVQVVPRRNAAWHHRRAQMIAELETTPEQHLILVRYSDKHPPHNEWVYNRADIDAAKVVWAREMDADANRKLLEYFSDRTHWLLLADEDPPQLLHYDRASSTIEIR